MATLDAAPRPAEPNLHRSPRQPLRPHLIRHLTYLRRLQVPLNATPTAPLFVQLAQTPFTVATLATPASSTVLETASAAND